MLRWFAAFTLFLGLVLLAVWLIRWMLVRSRVRHRWHASQQPERSHADRAPTGSRGWLSQWLYVAGYRHPYAATTFIMTTALCALVGFGAAVLFWISGAQSFMQQTVVLVPGGVGETFLPVVWVAPWLIAIMIVCIPWLIVRKARRERVLIIEQDLPLALELLSTLSEAGLGFEAAVTRILRTRLGGRPLASELKMYQADLLAGRPRVECLRRLSSRIRIGSVSILVSALVQAEQLGMGIARVLRQQADDVRARRRERAIAFANALPVKRLFPLVICFLPGLFVWTLGPAFVQLFKMAETFTRSGAL